MVAGYWTAVGGEHPKDLAATDEDATNKTDVSVEHVLPYDLVEP